MGLYVLVLQQSEALATTDRANSLYELDGPAWTDRRRPVHRLYVRSRDLASNWEGAATSLMMAFALASEMRIFVLIAEEEEAAAAAEAANGGRQLVTCTFVTLWLYAMSGSRTCIAIMDIM